MYFGQKLVNLHVAALISRPVMINYFCSAIDCSRMYYHKWCYCHLRTIVAADNIMTLQQHNNANRHTEFKQESFLYWKFIEVFPLLAQRSLCFCLGNTKLWASCHIINEEFWHRLNTLVHNQDKLSSSGHRSTAICHNTKTQKLGNFLWPQKSLVKSKQQSNI